MTTQIGIPTRNGRAWSIVLGVSFVLCWSSGFIGAKVAGDEAPTTTILMWRFLPLAIVLAPALGIRRGRADRNPPRQILVGALSQSGYLLTVYWAIDLGVSTGTTALVDGVQPLVAAALAGPLLGAAATGRQWIGLIVGAGGVLLATAADATATASTPWWAYSVPLVGMLCLVAATFVDRRGDSTTPMRALAIHCATSATIFTGLAVATGTAVPPSTTRFWLAVAATVVFATFGGYGLYWHLLDRIGVTRVNTLLFLVPPVTAVWGATVFDEPFTAMTAGGLGLTLVATWIVTGDHRPTIGIMSGAEKDSGEREYTDDGHYIVIKGRRWRATDPDIPDERNAELRSILMAWRRDVRATGGADSSRAGVQAAKVALGERGDPWWEQSLDERRARWEADVPRPGD